MKAFRLYVLLMFALLPIAACGPMKYDDGSTGGSGEDVASGGIGGSGDGGGDDEPSSSSASIKITLLGRQAPWMEALELTIAGIDLKPEGETDSATEGWIEIDSEPKVYDILQLTEGWEAIMHDAPVTFDPSNKMRIRIQSAAVSMWGKTYNIDILSSDREILALRADPLARDKYEINIDLEFDPIGSVTRISQDKWKLTPAFKEVDWSTVGSISGMVTPVGLGAEVRIYTSRIGELVTAVKVRADGSYTVPRLPAFSASGDPIQYTVTAYAEGYISYQVYGDVNVQPGENIGGYDLELQPIPTDTDSDDRYDGHRFRGRKEVFQSGG